MSQPTVDDVARLAGVSRQTVSNVLNSPDIVREATREKVRRAIAQLGYRPHASARRLRTRRSSTIGVRLDPMTNGISGSVLDRFLHAITETADARGLRVTLFTATDAQHEIEQISRLWDGADIDAVVLTSTVPDDPRTRWLAENGVPFVTFGQPRAVALAPIAHPWVDVDGFAGLQAATAHVIDEGAAHVAYVGWPDLDGTGWDRYRGWRDTVIERLGYDDAALHTHSTTTVDDVQAARRATAELIARAPGTDAIVASSDTVAIGAVMALGPGSGVPVIGYDNTPVARALGIASVDQPLDEVAEGALRLLFDEPGVPASGAATAERGLLLPPRLVVRHRGAIDPALLPEHRGASETQPSGADRNLASADG